MHTAPYPVECEIHRATQSPASPAGPTQLRRLTQAAGSAPPAPVRTFTTSMSATRKGFDRQDFMQCKQCPAARCLAGVCRSRGRPPCIAPEAITMHRDRHASHLAHARTCHACCRTTQPSVSAPSTLINARGHHDTCTRQLAQHGARRITCRGGRDQGIVGQGLPSPSLGTRSQSAAAASASPAAVQQNTDHHDMSSTRGVRLPKNA